MARARAAKMSSVVERRSEVCSGVRSGVGGVDAGVGVGAGGVAGVAGGGGEEVVGKMAMWRGLFWGRRR